MYNALSSGANVDLTMNAISSLIGERDAMAIRSKSLNYNYLSITESTASLLKIVMIGIVPLAYLGIGAGIMIKEEDKDNMKRAKRMKILLGILVVVSVMAFAVLHYQEKQENIKNTDETILQIESDTVSSLSWQYDDTSLSFHKRRFHGLMITMTLFPLMLKKLIAYCRISAIWKQPL